MSSENEKGAIGHNNDAQREQASNPTLGVNGRDRNLIPDNGETCDCAESRYQNKDGEVVPTGLHVHSCEFVKIKNSLIPAADAFADHAVASDSRDRRWARFFGAELDRLTREVGVR